MGCLAESVLAIMDGPPPLLQPDDGWWRCKDHARILKTLGIEVRVFKRHGVKMPIAPDWAVGIASLPYPNKRWKRQALERAISDVEWRNAILASVVLGGRPAEVLEEAMDGMVRSYRRW